MSKSEHEIQNEIRLALSSKDSIVFRTNAGTFYRGEMVYSKEFKSMVLLSPRRVDGLPKGFSDLVYFTKGGKTAFIECKNADGKLREEQKIFIDRMRDLGFVAGVARSAEEAKLLCQQLMKD